MSTESDSASASDLRRTWRTCRWEIDRLRRSACSKVLAGNGVVILLTAATGILTARMLGPAGRGEQTALIMWPQLLASLFAAGIPGGLLYNFRVLPSARPALLPVALSAGFVIGLGASAVGVGLVLWSLAGHGPRLIDFALLALAVTPLEMMSPILQSASLATERYDVYTRVRIAVPLLLAGFLVALPFVAPVTPVTVACAFVLSGLPVPALHFAQLWRQIRPSFRGGRAVLRPLLSYARRAAPVDFLTALSQQLDRALVVIMLPAAAIGLYVVATNATAPLSAVRNALISVVFPRAASVERDAAVTLTAVAAGVNAAATLLLGIVLACAGPLLLRVLYGGSFVEAAAALAILAAENVVTGTGQVASQIFMALGRPQAAVPAQLAWVLTVIPLMIFLARPFGVAGAATAVLLASCLRTTVVVVCLGRAGLLRVGGRREMKGALRQLLAT